MTGLVQGYWASKWKLIQPLSKYADSQSHRLMAHRLMDGTIVSVIKLLWDNTIRYDREFNVDSKAEYTA